MIYRCGFCGQQTDEGGNLIPFSCPDEEQWNNAQNTYGQCCREEWDNTYQREEQQ